VTKTSASSRPLRVLVVDADERVRESLRGLLAIGDRCVVIGSAGHPLEAIRLVALEPPDVVVVDPRLPDIDGGRALIMRLRQLAPGTSILVMGWSDGLEQDGMLQGADAFIRKTFRPRELVEAVVAAAGAHTH
jgi:DNA-binding NarL/FixJ family response regulator